jgi:hypothetical protein
MRNSERMDAKKASRNFLLREMLHNPKLNKMKKAAVKTKVSILKSGKSSLKKIWVAYSRKPKAQV